MPQALQVLADVFPVTWSLDAARDILVYGKPLAEDMRLILGSVIALIVIYIADIAVYKKLLRNT